MHETQKQARLIWIARTVPYKMRWASRTEVPPSRCVRVPDITMNIATNTQRRFILWPFTQQVVPVRTIPSGEGTVCTADCAFVSYICGVLMVCCRVPARQTLCELELDACVEDILNRREVRTCRHLYAHVMRDLTNHNLNYPCNTWTYLKPQQHNGLAKTAGLREPS